MNKVAHVDHDSAPAPAAGSSDPMAAIVERMAFSPDADLDKLERMLAMKERIDAQQAGIAFARALSSARAEMPPIVKDATVDFKTSKGHTHYRHETLAGIARQIDPILSKHGLSYRFRTEQGQGGVRVTCIVQHSDGHSEETSLTGAPDQSGNKNGFQAVGSAVTYLQRYTLKAALGLSAEVDDDAQGAAPAEQPPRQQRQPERETFNASAAARKLFDAIGGAGTTDDLTAIWNDNQGPLAQIKAADKAIYQDLRRAFGSRGEELKALAEGAPNADLGGDHIPY